MTQRWLKIYALSDPKSLHRGPRHPSIFIAQVHQKFQVPKPYKQLIFRWGFLHLGTWNVWWQVDDWDDIRLLFRDVVRAIAYCHSEGIAHRDLKFAPRFLQQKPQGFKTGDGAREYEIDIDYWEVLTQIFLEFSPRKFGEDEPTHFEDDIFQRGWFNHQLDWIQYRYFHIWTYI